MKFEETKEIYEMQEDLMYPGMELVVVAIQGNKGTFNGEEMNSIECVEKAHTRLIHKAINSDFFTNGNWVQEVQYADLETVANQTEENYYIDTSIMNYLFALKVIANECLKNPQDIYVAIWDSESGVGGYYKNEEITELKEYLKENFEE